MGLADLGADLKKKKKRQKNVSDLCNILLVRICMSFIFCNSSMKNNDTTLH